MPHYIWGGALGGGLFILLMIGQFILKEFVHEDLITWYPVLFCVVLWPATFYLLTVGPSVFSAKTWILNDLISLAVSAIVFFCAIKTYAAWAFVMADGVRFSLLLLGVYVSAFKKY